MNKTHKRKYNNHMSKPRFILSVIAYYLLSHIRGICSFFGWFLLALGLTLLYIDLPTALMLCCVGDCLIVIRCVIAKVTGR